jgi:hypothetical protein
VSENVKIKGSAFLEHPTINEHVEAAYRIIMELQERGILKVKINHKEGVEPYIQWEIDTDNVEQS